MNSINDCRTMHEYLEVYFKDGTATDKKLIPQIEQKITEIVETAFAETAEKKFEFIVRDSGLFLRKRPLIKVVELALKELHPECKVTLEDGGSFNLRGGDSFITSCLFTIERPQ